VARAGWRPLHERPSLEAELDPVPFESVRARLELQRANALQWRDVVNSYFLRKSGTPDERGRPIY
jgi:alpha-glucuronidase